MANRKKWSPTPPTTRCTMRVQDHSQNGECCDCDKPTVVSNRCEHHRVCEAGDIRKLIADYEYLRQRLDELDGEDALDAIALRRGAVVLPVGGGS